MELKQLERFLAVYDLGSLAEAAKSLQLTQQAISSTLANMEDEVGTRLFERAPGGITRPTEAGEKLVSHARAQLAADRRALEDLTDISAGRTGTITVGVGEAFNGDAIIAAVKKVQERNPGVRINLIEGYSEQLQYRLYDGEFDFIAAGVSAFELDEHFVREQIYSTDDVIICRREHPLAGKRKLTLADLAGYPWLVPYSRPSDLHLIVDTFAAAGVEPPTQIIGSDAYRIGMRLLAESDLLVMVSPALIATDLDSPDAPLARLNINQPTIRRHASLIYPKDRPMTAAAQLLLDEVRQQISASRFDIQ